VILVLIKRPNSLTVNNEALERFAGLILELDRLIPNPEALRAGINGWTYAEARVVLLIQQNSVK
jgi:hypothetical protein